MGRAGWEQKEEHGRVQEAFTRRTSKTHIRPRFPGRAEIYAEACPFLRLVSVNAARGLDEKVAAPRT